GAAFARRVGGRVKRAVTRGAPPAATAPPKQQEDADPMLRLAVDRALWHDPFPWYEKMRERGPAYLAKNSNVVVVTGFDQVSAVLKDDRYEVEALEHQRGSAGIETDC